MRSTLKINQLKLDLEQGGVFCEASNHSLELEQKSMKLLELLAKAGEKGCTRHELLDALWPNKVVSDDSLTNLVSQTRSKLKSCDANLIRTIPKKGYLLVGEITYLGDTKNPSKEPTANTESETSKAPNEIRSTQSEGNKLSVSLGWPQLVGLTVLTIVSLAVAIFTWNSWFGNSIRYEQTIAILPTQIVSQEQEAISAAANFRSQLSHRLSNYPGIFLVSQIESQNALAQEESIFQVANDLGAKYIVESQLQELSGTVKLTVQLVDGDTGLQVFSKIISAQVDAFVDESETIIQSVVRLVMAELPRGLIQTEHEFDLPTMQRKCDSYLELAKLYSEGILNDVYAIATPAETACIGVSQLAMGNAKAESKVAELYRLMALATQTNREEQSAFIRLTHDYLDKASSSDAGEKQVLIIRSKVYAQEIRALMNSSEDPTEKTQTAIEHIEKALKMYPNDRELLSQKAVLYVKQGTQARRKGDDPKSYYQTAENALSKNTQNNPNIAANWFELAKIHMAYAAFSNDTGESPIPYLEQTVEDYNKAIEFNAEIPEYFNSRGIAQSILADLSARANRPNPQMFDRAISDFEKAINLSRRITGVHSSLADLYRRQSKSIFAEGGDPSQLLEKGVTHGLQGIKESPESVWSYFTLMEIHRNGAYVDFAKRTDNLRHQQQCVEIGNKGMAIKSNSTRAWYSLLDCKLLAVRLFIESGQTEAAERALKNMKVELADLIKLDPDYGKTRQIKAQHEFLTAWIGEKDFSSAISTLETLLKKKPKYVDAKSELIEQYLYSLRHSKSNKDKLQKVLAELSQANSNTAEFVIQKYIFDRLSNPQNHATDSLNQELDPFGLQAELVRRKYQSFF